MAAKKNEAKPKKPYVKPQVTRVRITPEEVVLGNCKHGAQGGGPGGTCHLCGASIGS
jgi:hypothetical protein